MASPSSPTWTTFVEFHESGEAGLEIPAWVVGNGVITTVGDALIGARHDLTRGAAISITSWFPVCREGEAMRTRELKARCAIRQSKTRSNYTTPDTACSVDTRVSILLLHAMG